MPMHLKNSYLPCIATDNRVSEHDFVQQWTARYGDNHKDATTFFRNIDNFPDGELTEVDLLFHLGTLDPDGKSSGYKCLKNSFVGENVRRST